MLSYTSSLSCSMYCLHSHQYNAVVGSTNLEFQGCELIHGSGLYS